MHKLAVICALLVLAIAALGQNKESVPSSPRIQQLQIDPSSPAAVRVQPVPSPTPKALKLDVPPHVELGQTEEDALKIMGKSTWRVLDGIRKGEVLEAWKISAEDTLVVTFRRGVAASIRHDYATAPQAGRSQQPVYLDPIELKGQTLQGAAISRHDKDGSIALTAKGTAAGIEVVAVVPGGPAATAGLLPGDIVTSMDGVSVKGLQTIEGLELIAKKKAGESIDLAINRNGHAESIRVIAGMRERLYANDPVWQKELTLPPSVGQPIFGGRAKLWVGMFQNDRFPHHAFVFVNIYDWDGSPFTADDVKFFVLDGTNQQLRHISLDEINYSLRLFVAQNWRGGNQPLPPIPSRHEYTVSGVQSGHYTVTSSGGMGTITGSSTSRYTVTEKPDYAQLGYALLSVVQRFADAKANQKILDEANVAAASWEKTYFKSQAPIVPGEHRGGDIMYWTGSDRRPQPPYRVVVSLTNPQTQKDEYFTFAFGPGAEKIKQDLESQPQSQRALSNDDVVSMVRAGLGVEIVIAEINSAHCSFDTSPAVLIALKNAGVPDSVILAMVQAP